MEKEKEDNIDINGVKERNIINGYLYSKNNDLPTTFTEIIESREENTLPISKIMPKIKEFYISFQNQNNMDYNLNDNDTIEENKKIKIKKKDLYKILKMIRIPKDEINEYILFSFTSIKSEIVTNTIKAYKLDYNKLKKLIEYFYIQLGNKKESIEISKDSLFKIFDLLGITPNERLSLIQFFEVDEELEYAEENEEESEEMNDKYSSKNRDNIYEIKNKTKITTNKYPYEEDDEIINKENIDNNINDNKENDDMRNKKSKIKQKEKIMKPSNSKEILKNKNKKGKIKYIGGNNNIIDKIEKNNLDELKNIINNIPSIIEEIKNKNKKNERTKKNKSKPNLKNKEPEIIEIVKNKINYNNNSIKDSNCNEKFQSNSNWLEEKSQTFGKYSISKNISKYPFILPKSFEYGNSKMYLVGSIPELGNWNTNSAIPMNEELKNSQIFYTKDLDIKNEDFPFEYKFFYNKDGKIIWLGKSKVNYIAHKQYIDLYQSVQANKNIISIFDLNTRYLNKIDGYNIWDYRKQKLIQVILKYIPDILFFQEITRPQYEYIDLNLNSIYENVGIYRDNSDNSEKCSISFNKIKFTLTDWGQFWLSSTPYTTGSNDFGNFFPRICTWALLRQIDGIQFLLFNIHLDHANFNAHLRCINVVLNESEKILRNFPDTKIIFLGGCFYCEEDDDVVNKLKEKGYNEVMFENTFHDFTGEADRHWDYLFWKQNFGDNINIKLKKSFVLKEDSVINLRNQQFISDHYPFIAEFITQNNEENNEDNINNNEDNNEDNNDNDSDNNNECNDDNNSDENDNDINDSDNNKRKKNNANNDFIYDEEDKKEFSEMDEDENIRQSKEFEEYEEDNEDNNIKNSEKKANKNKENDEDKDNEEVEVIEVEEEIEENNDNKDKKENKNEKNYKENKENNESENEEAEEVEEDEEEVEIEQNEDEDKKEEKKEKEEKEEEENEEIEQEEVEGEPEDQEQEQEEVEEGE